jgi:hypothetical protein
MDMRMLRSPSWCIEGVLEGGAGPAALFFWIGEREPTNGESGDSGLYMAPPGGRSGPDGKIRICDLHPGDYQLTAFNDTQSSFGSATVSITDGDVRKSGSRLLHAFPFREKWSGRGKPPRNPCGRRSGWSFSRCRART